LLLGASDRVLGLTRRFAACFKDSRDPAFVEHSAQTLLTQRIVGIALGYEDLVDHDELRHDPVMAAIFQVEVGMEPPASIDPVRNAG
jgi:hypothetical protein